jgi:hypothetical protein
MMMLKGIVFFLFFLYLIPLVSATDINSCPGTLSSDTYYLLTSDINHTAVGSCFFAKNSRNIEIDLNWHTIYTQQSTYPSFTFEFYNANNITIKNGYINNYAGWNTMGSIVSQCGAGSSDYFFLHNLTLTDYSTSDSTVGIWGCFNHVYGENVTATDYNFGFNPQSASYGFVRNSKLKLSPDFRYTDARLYLIINTFLHNVYNFIVCKTDFTNYSITGGGSNTVTTGDCPSIPDWLAPYVPSTTTTTVVIIGHGRR